MMDIVLQTTADVFAKYLIEILLTVILAFNVSAYKYLYEEVGDVKEETEKNSDFRKNLSKRIFGFEQDDTSQGHIQETEDRFTKIDEKLEEICQKLDEESNNREEKFDMIERKIQELTEKLSDEENIDFSYQDIAKIGRYKSEES